MRRAAALGLYATLVVWLTWPLAAHLTTHIPYTHFPCGSDALHTAWVLAWETHTLLGAPSALFDANIYHPARHALLYGQTAFGALPYYAPTFLLTGNPALATNLMFLAGVALTAWTIHLVVRRWTGSPLGGFVAAWTFLMTRWVLWTFVPTAPQYALLHYLPAIMLLAATPSARAGDHLLLLALAVLACLNDPVYLAGAILFPLGLLALWRVARAPTRHAGLRLLAVVAATPLALLPPYAGYFAIRAGNPSLRSQSVWTSPDPRVVLPWGLLGSFKATALPSAALALIAIGGLRFVLAGRRTAPATLRSAWAQGALWATAGILLSLKPPTGLSATIPLGPLAQIEQFLRLPTRFGVAALVGLSVLAGLAFAECAPPAPSRGRVRPGAAVLACLLAVGMYAEYAHGVKIGRLARTPLPPSYPLLRTIAPDEPLIHVLRQPGGPLLEVPVLEGPAGAAAHARAMYRSIFHWRPLLNGYTGYWPAGFAERMALAGRLPDAEALAALRRETGLELILVHAEDLPAEQRAPWLTLAAGGGRADLRFVARAGDDLVFAVSG